MTERPFGSIREYCEAHGVDRTTVWRQMEAGKIVPKRVGRRVLIPRAYFLAHHPAHHQDAVAMQHAATQGNKVRRKRPRKSERNAVFRNILQHGAT